MATIQANRERDRRIGRRCQAAARRASIDRRRDCGWKATWFARWGTPDYFAVMSDEDHPAVPAAEFVLRGPQIPAPYVLLARPSLPAPRSQLRRNRAEVLA